MVSDKRETARVIALEGNVMLALLTLRPRTVAGDGLRDSGVLGSRGTIGRTSAQTAITQLSVQSVDKK